MRCRAAARAAAARPCPAPASAKPAWRRSGRWLRNHSRRAVKSGSLLQQLRLQRLHGEERNQSDHRADLQRHDSAVGQVQLVVIELVLVVPQAEALRPTPLIAAGDVEEVLEEFGRDVLVDRIVLRQFQRDAHQVQAIHRHPARAVGLVDVAAGRQRRAAVEDADVVEAEEAALENLRPCASLRFTHQVKLSISL